VNYRGGVGIIAAGNLVIDGRMADRTGKVGAFDGHMDVKLFIRAEKRRIEIAMLHTVGAATVKVAGSAIFTTGQTHILGHFSQIDRFKNLFTELFFLIGRMAAAGGKFLIGSGGIVTNQAVNVDFGSKIEIFILPTIPGMAAGAPAPV